MLHSRSKITVTCESKKYPGPCSQEIVGGVVMVFKKAPPQAGTRPAAQAVTRCWTRKISVPLWAWAPFGSSTMSASDDSPAPARRIADDSDDESSSGDSPLFKYPRRGREWHYCSGGCDTTGPARGAVLVPCCWRTDKARVVYEVVNETNVVPGWAVDRRDTSNGRMLSVRASISKRELYQVEELRLSTKPPN